MKNAINWFEIPVKNFDRAKKFYETLFGQELPVFEDRGIKMAYFPADLRGGGIGGCIIIGKGYEPSSNGSLVYINGGDDLDIQFSRVEKAGGTIVLPKTSIGADGFRAIFLDTEGNKVGLHSMQ